jgi:ketosteroid isomerase-like protein
MKPVRRGDEQTFDEVDAQLVQNFFYIWSEAVKNHDGETLRSIIADEYSFISPRGSFHNKEVMAECVENDIPPSTGPTIPPSTPSGRTPTRPSGTSMMFLEPQFEIFKVSDDQLKAFGNTALRTGKITVKGVHNERDVTGEFRYSNVFVKRNSQWQVVATHITKIAA